MLILVGVAAFPTILLYLLIVVVFLTIVYAIISKAPAPLNNYAWWAVLVLGGIILLVFLVSLVSGGSSWRL